MPETRLAGFHLDLTPEQKGVLNQFVEKDWTRFIVVAATEKEQLPKEHGPGAENKDLVNVLYEADADLWSRLKKSALDTHVSAEKEGPRTFNGLHESKKPANGAAKVNFSGIIASAAVW
jgi:hypothetical protein